MTYGRERRRLLLAVRRLKHAEAAMMPSAELRRLQKAGDAAHVVAAALDQHIAALTGEVLRGRERR